MEGGILWKKLMHNSNKRGVEGVKTWRVEFFKISKRGPHVY